MADIEAKITFFTTEEGGRTTPVFSGYRPAHLVNKDYLTTGIHQYYDREKVGLGETVLGTIKFITSEAYTECLWVGKRISIQEASHIVGYAVVTKVFNETLLKKM
jgi:translation elongation factor EF-Tu-like GTPase